jgi:SRSO17 transposase
LKGHRWAIEECFEIAQNEFGLNHDERPSWHGWHRHVSQVLCAFAILAAIRRRTNEWLEEKTNESKKN